MKLSYKDMVKEPFILELNTDEIGTLRYYLKAAEEKLASDVLFNESYVKYAKDKEEKKWRTKHWKSSLRSLKDLKKVVNDLEHSVKTIVWPR